MKIQQTKAPFVQKNVEKLLLFVQKNVSLQ